LAHHSKKVVVASFVAQIIWTHQVSTEANFLAGVTNRTIDITVLLSLLSVTVSSSSSSLGHV